MDLIVRTIKHKTSLCIKKSQYLVISTILSYILEFLII